MRQENCFRLFGRMCRVNDFINCGHLQHKNFNANNIYFKNKTKSSENFTIISWMTTNENMINAESLQKFVTHTRQSNKAIYYLNLKPLNQ